MSFMLSDTWAFSRKPERQIPQCSLGRANLLPAYQNLVCMRPVRHLSQSFVSSITNPDIIDLGSSVHVDLGGKRSS